MKLLISALMFSASIAAQAEIVDISLDEFKSLMKQGVKVIDLRTAGEWQQTGVIPGNHMITLFDENGRADPVAWQKEVSALSAPNQPVVLICRSGNRSGKAAKILNDATPSRKIYNVKAGMMGWVGAGQAVVPYQQNLKTAGIRCSPAC